MKPLYKKLIVVGVILILGFIVYLIWSSAVPENPPNSFSSSTSSGFPASTPLKAPTSSSPLSPEMPQSKKLSEHQVFDYWINQNTSEVYYLTPEGKVYAAREGPDLEVSAQTIDALNAIQLSPSTEKILASFGDPRAPQWGFFDVIDKVWRPLPRDILMATWGTKDEELIATTQKNSSQTDLVRADISKTPPVYKMLIKNFNLHDVTLKIFSDQELLISERPSATYGARTWKLNFTTLALTLFREGEEGSYLSWGSHNQIAFQFSLPRQFRILEGATLALAMPFPFTTFPDKCSEGQFEGGEGELYCFVPQASEFESLTRILPDDYFRHAFFTHDTLYRIDFPSGDFEPIILTGAIDGTRLEEGVNGLYFINRYDKQLYRLAQ